MCAEPCSYAAPARRLKRWIGFGLLLGVFGLGAWVLLSMAPARGLSIQFLDYRTNQLGQRALRVCITNQDELPIYCHVRVVSNAGVETPPTVETIEPHCAIHHRIAPDPVSLTSTNTWRLTITAHLLRSPLTGIDMVRYRLGVMLKNFNCTRLSKLVLPRGQSQTVRSAPIPLSGDFTEAP
jgi:hypothetical protein